VMVQLREQRKYFYGRCVNCRKFAYLKSGYCEKCNKEEDKK
jgi:uncharacterized OB-fold protein